jgi:hypothetical protein
MMPERANRTFICSVLFLDITEYSRKPVSEQIQLKDEFNTLIAEAIRDIAPNDRIILDTGDGVAINFLGDPEDALFVAMSLREAFAPRQDEPPRLPARIGINLGPVRLVRDLNGQPNIIGDGINVAQRVMGFAKPGQVLVSRSYFEVVSHISEGYAKLFHYEGSRTDKHVREHEIYSVGYSQVRPAAMRTPGERAQPAARDGQAPGTVTNATGRWLRGFEHWMNNRAIAYGTATLSLGAFALGVVVNLFGHNGDLPAAQDKAPTEATAQRKIPIPEKSAAASQSPAKPKKERNPARPVAATASDPAATNVAAAEKPDARESKAGPFTSMFGRDDDVPPPPPPPSAGTAVIALAVAPWGEIYVDGDRVGVSPPVNEVEVAPGKRTIEIRNGNFPVYSQVVDVKADQRVRIKHKFN